MADNNKQLLPGKQLITLLKKQWRTKDTSKDFFVQLKNELEIIKQAEFDPNFRGTINELSNYINSGLEQQKNEEEIYLHDLNYKRWIEELELLVHGSSAVTIDYKQRKNRQI